MSASGEEPSDLRLRPATTEDAELLLSWRNDPETRRRSHGSEPVEWDEHLRWLTAGLASPDRRILIAELGDQPVGTVRADREDGVWELSWTVAPDARGRGLGSAMVKLLADEIREPIRAEVKSDHPASGRIAEKAGMRYDFTDGDVLHYRRPAVD